MTLAMKTKIVAVNGATFDAMDEIAKNMRHEDVRDIEDATPISVAATLRQSAKQSAVLITVYASLDREVPLCVAGIVPCPQRPYHGFPWMLCSEAIRAYPKETLKLAPVRFRAMRQPFASLENWVHADNKGDIKLLTRLGFVLLEPRPWGYKNKLYRRFYWESAFNV